MSELVAGHAKRVLSVVEGALRNGAPDAQSPITRSWLRCFKEYGLDPAADRDTMVIGRIELEQRREQLSELLDIAKVEMANLYQQLAGSGYAIMLTDAEGTLINYFGDPGFTSSASRAGLVPGAVWSERLQGTNGMGTCLAERQPVVIHHQEHFLARNTGLTCSAAPIFDHRGNVLAVLDASARSDLRQQHTLVLVNMSAQMIENRAFLARFRDHSVVRFHSRPEFVGTLGEGSIAFDGEGRVVAANRSALFQLGLSGPAEIKGREISEIFNVTLPRILDASVRNSFHPSPVFEASHGGRFFAVAQEPEQGSQARGAARPMRRDQAADAQRTRCPLDELGHGDPVVAENLRRVKRVLDRDVAILICGETGTGKELLAKAVHQSSSRADKPFVAINCASIPETLIESELFGYKAGAFTGANRDGRRGKIFQANGGTLFLDEIGDMPLQLQARLLRVLEEREVLPLGSEIPVKVDIRVISATHRDLPQLIREGLFREDLYYRLQGLTLSLPALRERTDRRELIRHLLRHEQDGGEGVEIEPAALRALEQHPWPGNIRQLRNVLRITLALREGPRVTLRDLPAEVSVPLPEADAGGTAAPALNPLESAERDALLRELEQHHWNITNVARKLEVSRNTLYRKMQRLNIRAPGKPA